MLATYQNYLVGQIYFVDSALAMILIGKGSAELCPYGVVNSSASITRPADTTDYTAGDSINSVAAQVKQKETLTITGQSGSAVITCGGLTKTITFDTDVNTTVAAFQVANVAAFLAAGIVLTNDAADLIFEASAVGVPFVAPLITAGTSDIDGTVVHTQANVAAVKQKEIITLTGTFGKCVVTGAGSLTKVGEFNTTLDQTAADFVTAHAAAYLAVGIVLTASTDTLIFEANVAGTSFSAPVIAFEVSSLDGTVLNVQANIVAAKQKNKITLSGTGGTAYIAGTITEHLLTWDTSLGDTAAAYVLAKAADYLPGVVLTAVGVDLFFEASVAGTPFTPPTISNVIDDLDGTVSEVTANAIATKQEDTIPLTGTAGYATITLAGVLTKLVEFNTDLTTTASDFVTAFAADYAAQDIVLTSFEYTLIFEAAAAGTGFDSPAIETTASDLAGTVDHNTANVVALKMKDTITVEGTFGAASIAAAGGLTKLLTFATSITASLQAFVTANAAAYLAQAIVLTSSGEDLIFEAQAAGTAFTSPTITTLTNLDGSVAHTTANVSFDPLVFEDLVPVSGGSGNITRVIARTTNVGFAGKKLRLWLYNALPTPIGDNLALNNPCDISKNAFAIDLTFEAQTIGTDTQVFAQADVDVDFVCVDKDLWGAVQALETMTPISAGVLALVITAK